MNQYTSIIWITTLVLISVEMVSACYMLFSHWLQVKILKWIHKEATWKLWKVNNSRQIGVESQILKNELQVPSRLFWSSLLFRSQLWLKGSQMPEMLAGANRKNSERNNLFLSRSLGRGGKASVRHRCRVGRNSLFSSCLSPSNSQEPRVPKSHWYCVRDGDNAAVLTPTFFLSGKKN